MGVIRSFFGGYDSPSEDNLFKLLEGGEIVAPLTPASVYRAPYLEAYDDHPLVQKQISSGRGGVVFFSSATTGEPKVVLHDYQTLRLRYDDHAKRKPLRTISFLGFDHIGGFNTLLYSRATGLEVVRTTSRDPAEIWRVVERENVRLLPVTPTFLRMMDPDRVPRCIRVISYGSERMDQPTLSRVCDALPWVDFRQMYGSSEMGILRTRSKARDSLWFEIDTDDGTDVEVVDGELRIRREHSMLGYLNAPSPLDSHGWYRTGDIVEVERERNRRDWIRVLGRRDFVINCGGEKVLPSEIEDVAMAHPSAIRAKAFGIPNAILGQAIEVIIQIRGGPSNAPTLEEMRRHFAALLPETRRPHRILFTRDQIRGKS